MECCHFDADDVSYAFIAPLLVILCVVAVSLSLPSGLALVMDMRSKRSYRRRLGVPDKARARV